MLAQQAALEKAGFLNSISHRWQQEGTTTKSNEQQQIAINYNKQQHNASFPYTGAIRPILS